MLGAVGMIIAADQDYGVITGDLVRSSALSADERLGVLAEIKRASQTLQASFANDLVEPIDIFRGDGWQAVVARPGSALRVALLIRAWIRTFSPETSDLDTRVAVAIGRVHSVPSQHVSEGDGEAFRASGHALDGLREPLRMALVPPASCPPGAAATLQAFVPSLDAVIQGWTQRQARATLLRLQGATQEHIASQWPERITRQAVARHLAKARWPAIEATLTWWESNPWRLQN